VVTRILQIGNNLLIIKNIMLAMSVYIMARISTLYGNQIVTENLIFIMDYKSGIRDSKLGIITCIN
jgi:hypothetical protein